MRDLYWLSMFGSTPLFVCYDNEETEEIETEETETEELGGDEAEKKFTQADLNKLDAETKRKYRTQLQKMETNYEELLKSKNLSDEERTRMESDLEDVRKQMRTKEQQALIEKQKLEKGFKQQLEEKDSEAKKWKSKYEDSTIRRSLTDAASKGGAFNPSQVVSLLRNGAHLNSEDDSVSVTFEDRDSEGNYLESTMAPEAAIARMQDLTDIYGNLFKSNVNGGIGGNSATGGLQPGKSGSIDWSNMTPEQYAKARKENPSLVGL